MYTIHIIPYIVYYTNINRISSTGSGFWGEAIQLLSGTGLWAWDGSGVWERDGDREGMKKHRKFYFMELDR